MTGQVAFLIEDHEIEFAVGIKVGRQRRCAPLGLQVLGERLPPIESRRRFIRPEWKWLLCEAVLRISQPLELGPDRVDQDVILAIGIPIGDGQCCVAPLRFGGPLD